MTRNSNQRSAAFEAYVLRGRDLEAISDETGVPLGTLKRWAADGRESPDRRSWHAMRLANYRDRSAITANFFSLAAKKISDATRDGATAQDQYAAINFFKALAGEKPEEVEVRKEELALRREKIAREREALKQAADKATEAAKKITGRELTPEEVRVIEDIYGIGQAA